MLSSPSARRRAAALLPPALAAAALLVAARWAPPPTGGWAPAAGLGLAVVGALAALHRPFGGRTLGLGAAALAPAAVLAGPVGAGLAAAVVMLLAEAGRAVLHHRLDLPRPAVAIGRAAGAAGRAALAALAGALAGRALSNPSAAPFPAAGAGPSPPAVAAGGAEGRIAPAAGVPGGTEEGIPPALLAAAIAACVYLLVSIAFSVAMRELRTPGAGSWWRRALPRRREAAPYLLDLAGWAAGGALAAAGRGAGWGAAAVLLAMLGLAGAEAARQAALRAAAERRLAGFGRVRLAGERMIAPARELDAVVGRFADECANVVGCRWFQLDLHQPAEPGGEDRLTVWSAGPDRALAEGEARPDPYPPPLPGVHRRAGWRVLERSLGAQGGVSARLTLWCDPRRLVPEDLELLEALLPQMAASLHQALLDREAREDPLTGVAVRRVLDRRLHAAWAAASEGGGPLAVILADVDRFKAINDTRGHAAGDAALAAVATALVAGKREADLLARFGGEEFAVLLENTEGDEALAIAERLRLRVAEVELETEDGPLPPLSISAGVASFPELTVKTAGELLLLADEALYEAKARGRDRCLLHRGRGRFLSSGGEEIGDDPGDGEPRAPRLFA